MPLRRLSRQVGSLPVNESLGAALRSIKSTEWIVSSAIQAAEQFRLNFFYLYMQHLDYAPQKFGPESRRDAAAASPISTLRLGDSSTGFADGIRRT